MNALEVKLGPGQMKVFQSKARFILLCAGIQSGKTYVGTHWMNHQVDQYPDDDHLIMASSYKVLTQATLKKFEDNAPQGWYEKVKSPDEFYYRILPGNGRSGKGRIWIRSAESANKIEGMTLRSCWFDESGDAPEMAFTNVQGRLSIKQGKLLMTTTPYTWNWLKKFIEDWERDTQFGARPGELSYDYINYPSSDNPYFPRDEFLRARKALARHDFERRYLGKFTRPEGLIYSVFDHERMIWSLQGFADLTATDPIHEVFAGVDWGYNDPAVICVIGVTQGGKYLILDEWYQQNREIGEIVEAGVALKNKWNITYFYADSANPERIRAFNSAHLSTVPVKKTASSNQTSFIKEGISRIRQLIVEGRFFVLEDCKNTLDELGSYRYRTKELAGTKVIIDEPADTDNHIMDTMRYAIGSHWPTITEEVETKKEWNILDRMQERFHDMDEGVYLPNYNEGLITYD